MFCKIAPTITAVLWCVLVLASLNLVFADSRYSRRLAQQSPTGEEVFAVEGELDRLFWYSGGAQPCKTSFACPATEPYCLRGKGKIKGLCVECLSDAACSGSKICDPITYSCKDPAVVYLSGSDPKSQITAIYGCTRDLSTCDKQFELSGTSAAFFSSNGDTVLINSNIENQIIGARKDGLQLVDIKNNTVNVELGFGGFASPEVAFFPQYPPFLSNGKIYACDVSGQTVSNCQDSGFMPPSITNSRGTSSIFLVSVNLYGGYAFIVAFYGSSSKIISCKVSGKNLTDCKLTGPTVDGFFNNIAFSGYEGGAFAFFGGSGGQTGNLTRCTVQSEGTLGACEDGGSVGKLPIIISILESTVYATIAESNDPVLRVCQITGGKVGDCTDKTPLPPGEIPLTVLAVL